MGLVRSRAAATLEKARGVAQLLPLVEDFGSRHDAVDPDQVRQELDRPLPSKVGLLPLECQATLVVD